MMTNREWLNSLSNEDFVNWLYEDKTMMWDMMWNKFTPFAPSYSPCLSEIVNGWTSCRERLKMWLNEEREIK